MAKTAIQVDEATAELIDTQIKHGSYVSVDEVVRAGLRLLHEHDARVRALDDALAFGEQSGEPEPFDFEAFKRGKRAGYQASGN